MGPIAVFDSGVGGLSVLRELVAQMPSEHFLYFGDSANAPYGTRPTAEIRSLTLAHAERLFDRGAKALVVACNTATSAAIGALRARWPDRVIIGIEPALKLAVSRHPGGCIGVLATEATLREEKFAALLQRCAENCHILKCPCPELVEFVERGELTGPALERCLAARLAPVLAAGPDALVLGCTHFPFAAGAIRRVVGPDVELLDGSAGTARETKRRLLDAGLLVQQGEGSVTIENSLDSPAILALSRQLLHAPIFLWSPATPVARPTAPQRRRSRTGLPSGSTEHPPPARPWSPRARPRCRSRHAQCSRAAHRDRSG